MNNILGGDYITFKYRYRKQIIIGIISFIIIVSISSYFIYNYISNNKNNKSNDIVMSKKNIKKKDVKEDEHKYLSVDIKGEVVLPGIYSLEEGSRVIDVINMAGGLTENANTSVINLSKKIVDEMVIIVYSNNQINDFKKTKEEEAYLQTKCIEGDGTINNDACIESNNQVSGKININTATKEELMTLNGIGDAKANDIINYRNNNGPFNAIEDILKVSGIGDNIYSQIKESITV